MVFPVHPRTRKMVAEFGIEFDGIRAIEPLGFLEFLQLEANARLALTDSGGGPGGDVHPGRALRDAAGEHGEAGDCGCGCECAGGNRISAHIGRCQKDAWQGSWLEESVRRWDCRAENYSDPGELVQAKRNGKRIACRLPARLTDKPPSSQRTHKDDLANSQT